MVSLIQKVVVAMRDLFQVVFELKKKEIEDAKTMLENKEQQQVQKSKVGLNVEWFNYKYTHDELD